MKKHKIKMDFLEWAAFFVLIKECCEMDNSGLILEFAVIEEHIGKYRLDANFENKKHWLLKESEKIAFLRVFTKVPIYNDELNIERNNLITKLDQIGGYR